MSADHGNPNLRAMSEAHVHLLMQTELKKGSQARKRYYEYLSTYSDRLAQAKSVCAAAFRPQHPKYKES